MAFGLYSLLEAALLCLNAICVLHEERFLAKSRYQFLNLSGKFRTCTSSLNPSIKRECCNLNLPL